MFHELCGHSHKTVSINHNSWRARRAEVDWIEVLLLSKVGWFKSGVVVLWLMFIYKLHEDRKSFSIKWSLKRDGLSSGFPLYDSIDDPNSDDNSFWIHTLCSLISLNLSNHKKKKREKKKTWGRKFFLVSAKLLYIICKNFCCDVALLLFFFFFF